MKAFLAPFSFLFLFELFVFFLSCLQFIVYSAVVCLTALQPFIKALLSIIWCSQLKLRKAFGVVWLILPPPTLCSPRQRCFWAFSPRAPAQRSLDESVKLYMQRCSPMIWFSDPVFQRGVIFCEHYIKTEPQKNKQTNKPSSSHRALNLHSSVRHLNPPFKYSHKDFYLSHIHIF